MITRPLDLQSKLSSAPRSFDGLFWLNVGLVALFFTLMGSKFVLPVGVAIGTDGNSTLPQASSLAQGVSGPTVVVSYRSENVILFEDGIYSSADLTKQMERYIKAHPGSVVLLRINAEAPVKAFTEISEKARALGYAGVVLAAERSPNEGGEATTPPR
ncbi:MAG TPA: biopolymer transporter ExbD [Candidatus Didemnitutus sp.]|nr:biopolymer transporter ExbD [Candidatus Didemnitutus sp.]